MTEEINHELKLIEICEKALREYLEPMEVEEQVKGQILINTAANLFIRTIYRVIREPEVRIQYVNNAFQIVIRELNNMGTAEMLKPEIPEEAIH